jgi:hypothetical protein
MNCRLIKHRPYRTPIIREDQFSVGGLLNLELLLFNSQSTRPMNTTSKSQVPRKLSVRSRLLGLIVITAVDCASLSAIGFILHEKYIK